VVVGKTNSRTSTFQMAGFNPFLFEIIEKEAYGHFLELRSHIVDPEEVIFCGAGCIDISIKTAMGQALSNIFLKANIEVYDDLEFIGRILKIQRKSIIAIMGTGTNAGYWKNGSIAQRTYSGGYLLGDEGSGFKLGKDLIINYLRNNFTSENQRILKNELGIGDSLLLKEIYRSKYPNRFIANYTKLYHLFEDPLKDQLINKEFTSFIRSRVEAFLEETDTIHLFGSISYHFRDYLIPLLEQINLKIGILAKNPIEAYLEKNQYRK